MYRLLREVYLFIMRNIFVSLFFLLLRAEMNRNEQVGEGARFELARTTLWPGPMPV